MDDEHEVRPRKLSELIAEDPRLDAEIDLADDDIITDITVLLRTTTLASTDDALLIGASEGTGGIVQYGLVCAAKLQVEDWMVNGDGDAD